MAEFETIINRLDPTGIYFPSDLDEVADSKYYGFLSSKGYWYIMRIITSTGSIRYYSGNGVAPDTYTTAWTNRATLGYNYANLINIK